MQRRKTRGALRGKPAQTRVVWAGRGMMAGMMNPRTQRTVTIIIAIVLGVSLVVTMVLPLIY